MTRGTFLALLLGLAACRGEPGNDAPGFSLRISLVPTPPIEGPTRVVVEIRDPEGEPVEGARVRLRGDMAHAGMIPVEEALVDEGAGRYAHSSFDFTMGGDWILTTTVELPDGRGMERTQEVRVVSSPDGDPQG